MASLNRDEISRLELLHAAHPDGLVFPHLADAYRRAGRYAQAETVLSAGLRRHSDYSSAHLVLGRLRLDQGKHGEAERAFRRVLELDPQNHVALEYLGRVSVEQGHLEEALGEFRKLARLKPSQETRERLRELEQRVARLRHDDHRTNGPRPEPGAAATGGGGVAGSAPGGERPANGAATRRALDEDDAGDPPLPRLPEPGEVVTETMAELYTRQGLHNRAAAVYRQLLDRTPGDARLRGKLAAVEAQLPGEEAGGPAQTSIREHMGALLSWKPDPSARPRDPAHTRPRDRSRDVPRDRPRDRPRDVPRDRPRDVPRNRLPERAEPSTEASVALRGPREEGRSARSIGVGPRGSPRSERQVPQGDMRLAERPVERPEEGGASSATRAAGEQASRSLIAITDMLVGLLEYRDPFFRGSSSLTRLVAEKVGEELGLDASQRTDLALAAVLRDLGRLAMGGRLISQAGRQTPEARRKIERHVDLALELLEGIELPSGVRAAVRHHHERWDGAGYPDGLSGEAIPLLARVLAVVDSFAAMVSPRSYRLPRKVPDAARELRDAAGTQYDPSVVAALMGVLERRDQPHLGFAQRPHLLMVSPDQSGAVVTAAKLCSAGYLAEVAADTTAARERLRRVPVAALVVSAEGVEGEAAAFVRQLRVDPTFSSLPVVVVDAEGVALRVRLLESGADVCLPPGTSHAELQGTLGALVRRTLRGRRSEGGADEEGEAEHEAPWLALQGDVEDFPLTWLLQVMKYDSRTAAIGIRTASEDGAIYLERGDAVHAQVRGGPKGEPALRRMLKWGKGRFTVQPDAIPRERTIETSIMHLLLTQAVDEDHAAAGIFGAVSEAS